MPIFHDPHESPPGRPLARQTSPISAQRPRAGEKSLDEASLGHLLASESHDIRASAKMDPESPSEARKFSMFDRVELIERLKRVNSPSRQQQDVSVSRTAQPHIDSVDHEPQNETFLSRNLESRPVSQDRPRTPLLPAAELRTSRTSTPDPLRDVAAAGLAIERPRSALHSGDFREEKEGGGPASAASSTTFLATSPVAPWNRSFPAAALPSHHTEASFSFHNVLGSEPRAVTRARATSQSSTSPFAFLPPTSPLVHQANNTDLDFSSRPGSRQPSRSPERNNRRHTFSPASFQTYQGTAMSRSASGTPAARHLRYGGAIPYQAHQPRRSLTTGLSQSQSSPQTPFLGSRRPSFSSDASPLQHAPMVGSYEESILRGRMSTTPSRPLNFVAKIGVLGKGKCKASLKCPPHVTVPFPAVFYSYNTGNGRISDNEPSPYVGLIDLENSLPAPEENTEDTKRKRRHVLPSPDRDDLDIRITNAHIPARQNSTEDLRKREKRKRRSTSPKAPPGGCYRIPPQGQLQVVLKNPNKTAVKLFLVPYDLSDMEPGQKTFIRQRSYSAGPIIDMPNSSRKNLGTDRPDAALSNSEDPNDRPILRYLIHLHICCPSKGRYYLYKSIRVVFANRVPDGKEKLRNEIQLPEPKYSTYKPSRDPCLPQSTSAHLAADKAFRRRSAGWPLSRSQQAFDQLDGISQRPPLPPPAMQFTGGPLSSSASPLGYSSPLPDLQPIPFSLTRLAAIESRPTSRDKMEIDQHPTSPFRTPLASPKSRVSSPFNPSEGTFEKLSKGDVGYGGNAFSPPGRNAMTSPGAGLLSQKLRSLEVEAQDDDRSE